MSTSAVTTNGLRTIEDYQKTATTPKTGSSELSIDDFLKLFIAQMQNQDPIGGDSSGGNSNMDYISQLAQFTMLKQLSALDDQLTASKAYSLIGKYVYIDTGNDSNQIFGKVDGVVTKDGEQCVVVGGNSYGLSKVSAVVNDTSECDTQIIKSADLIGKQVTAKVTGNDETTTTVTGIVEKVTVQDGLIYVTIGDQSLPLSSITEITAADTNDSTQSA
jgi:flagellar basal-body rod modification protein FlgD